MLSLLVVIASCAFLYGFTWHNQPAREREEAEHPTFGQSSAAAPGSEEHDRKDTKP